MAFVQFENIQITSIASCVPVRSISNIDVGNKVLDSEKLLKTISTIGINNRHITDENVCASDLCFKKRAKLIESNNIDVNTIDAIIFVTQTPDFRIPATACDLQRRLSLRKDVLAFDVNMGCSGYIYGLFNSFALANTSGINRVLLLVGDTISKFISENDPSTSLLFGDAGSATLIDKVDLFPRTSFTLNTDGTGLNAIYIPTGGYRNIDNDIAEELKKQHKHLECLILDGAEVFNFTIREVGKDIKNALKQADESIELIDKVYLHQANQFIIDYLAKKIKVEKSKTPTSLLEYGNTSSASIPLTISLNKSQKKVVLSGFGVGLSWGTCIVSLKNCKIMDVITYD